MSNTKIEWAEKTWNPISGCTKISEACEHCYAERMSKRLAGRYGYPKDKPFSVTLHPDKLSEPLKWKKPSRIFVCSMGDLFHPDVSNELIDVVFAAMALCADHTFLLLTKRPERMQEYISNPNTPYSITRAMDEMRWREAAKNIPYRIESIPGFPDYLIDNCGAVFSKHGSSVCVWCGADNEGYAKRKYCSQKCKEKAQYQEKMGRPLPFDAKPQPMSPDIGEDGHMRIMLYRDGKSYRELVHRIVLTVFNRPPNDGEEGMHSDGNPTHNHIANLSWGSQSENWKDRLRHGRDVANGHIKGDYYGLNWPLPNIFCGVTAENQARADERIPILLQIPAAVRFVSIEPCLSDINLGPYLWDYYDQGSRRPLNKLHQIICGGETGPGARPMHPDWARSLRDQCQAAGTAFFLKSMHIDGKIVKMPELDGRKWGDFPDGK